MRKRSTSDSGYSAYSGESSSHCGSDGLDSPVVLPKAKTSSHHNHGLSFLRLFHKSSATLQLQHPKLSELNPDKPYKRRVMTSMDHQSSSGNYQQVNSAPSKKKHKELLHYRHKKKLPLVPKASSSLSSLNSTSAVVNLKPVKQQGVSLSQKQLNPAGLGHHSSSNSVISTGDESSASGGRGSSSNYDSGAFSRTSSPTGDYGPVNLSLSMTRLALVEPLVAPKLVLAAQRGEWPPIIEAEQRMFSPANAHKPVNVAERSRQMHRRQMRARSMSTACGRKPVQTADVSVTIGANTMLTFGSPVLGGSRPEAGGRLSNLRRSRSGLPVLGTLGLNAGGPTANGARSPSKPLRSNHVSPTKKRNKISTVYLDSLGEGDGLRPSPGKQINRSESVVTVTGSKPAVVVCDCNERVTVNGQHHCAKHMMVVDTSRRVDDTSRHVFSDLTTMPTVVDRSTNTTPVNALDDLSTTTQPNSLILI